LAVLDRVGLPLPLFLRGDDAEFGYRLLKHSIPTVTFPGLGVWHEPFYLKTEGVQQYYDLRNMLVLTAIHEQQPGWRLALFFLLRLGHRLLSLDYFQGRLLCEAVGDFCRGPELLEEPPGEVHGKLGNLRRRYPTEVLPRHRPLTPRRIPRPTSHVVAAFRLAQCVVHQLFRSDARKTATPRVLLQDPGWWSLGRTDVAAVDGWEEEYRVVRRSRTELFRLVAHGLRTGLRLWRTNGRTRERWRAAFERLTSDSFWRRYLDLPTVSTSQPAPPRERAA
jgi:galactofuranosylgalactofuranosylrhamnosyl-N-acetylglucosaminyl-diphospho-decaprenol beta-1,5/1,6-galactofuranosyltransferase